MQPSCWQFAQRWATSQSRGSSVREHRHFEKKISKLHNVPQIKLRCTIYRKTENHFSSAVYQRCRNFAKRSTHMHESKLEMSFCQDGRQRKHLSHGLEVQQLAQCQPPNNLLHHTLSHAWNVCWRLLCFSVCLLHLQLHHPINSHQPPSLFCNAPHGN